MTPQRRVPAVAGTFYPASPIKLRQMIETYFAEAAPPALSGVRAVIVPHAGYIYSGPIAASAYKLLAGLAPPKRIYLLGPSHRVWFEGVAVGDYESLETPLGLVPVDQVAVQQLLEAARWFAPSEQAHRDEHCLEVQLPFLQTVYPETPVILLLFGEVNPDAVAAALLPLLQPDDLIVVSSDLSHYHSYDRARTLDGGLLAALEHGDLAAAAQGEACGQAPILTLMALAQARGWRPHVLDYRNSGDTAGDRHQVVGYAAVAYTEA